MKTSVWSRILPIAAAALLAGGLATSMVEAATIVVDDFESYASEAAFDAAWFPVNAGSAPRVPATLDTGVAHTGSQSMRIDYDVSVSQFFGQIRNSITPSQDWRNFTQLEFWYLGQATNSQERLSFRIADIDGEIVNVPFPAGQTFTQTQVTSWTRGVVDFSTLTPAQKNRLGAVTHVRIGIAGVGGTPPSDFGTGVMWFDDIRVVPEPTALGLAVLAAFGCLLHRRKLSH